MLTEDTKREVLNFLRIISTILEKKLNKSQAILAHLAKERV